MSEWQPARQRSPGMSPPLNSPDCIASGTLATTSPSPARCPGPSRARAGSSGVQFNRHFRDAPNYVWSFETAVFLLFRNAEFVPKLVLICTQNSKCLLNCTSGCCPTRPSPRTRSGARPATRGGRKGWGGRTFCPFFCQEYRHSLAKGRHKCGIRQIRNRKYLNC